MKILAFSDLHLSEKIGLIGSNTRDEQGVRRSIKDALNCCYWIADTAWKNEVDMIVFAGDFFDRPKPTPNEYEAAFDILTMLTKVAPVTLLVGNHDQTIGPSADATTPIAAANIPSVTVIDEPCVEVLKNLSGEKARLFFLPYPPTRPIAESKEHANAMISRDMNAILANFANLATTYCNDGDATPNVLVAHVTFSGCEYGAGQLVPLTDVQLATGFLPEFDYTIAGHLHKRQTIGGYGAAHYIGTPDRWSFNDEGNEVGVLLLEFDADSASIKDTFIEYPDARQFVSLKVDDFLSYEIGEQPSRVFLRCVGAVDSSERYEAVVDKVRALSKVGLGGLRNDVVLTRVADELPVVEDRDDVAALFDSFNEARPDEIPVDKRPAVLARIEGLIQADS